MIYNTRPKNAGPSMSSPATMNEEETGPSGSTNKKIKIYAAICSCCKYNECIQNRIKDQRRSGAIYIYTPMYICIHNKFTKYMLTI